MYLLRCCTKSVSDLCDTGRSLLGGDPCRGALEVPTLFTDVDDSRLLAPETKQDLHHKPSRMIKYKKF